jgi:hypothetical protein
MLKNSLLALTGLLTLGGVVMFVAGWNTAAQGRADELMGLGGGLTLLCGMLFLVLLVKRAF